METKINLKEINTMKIVEKSNQNEFVITCPVCGATLIAKGNEFTFVSKGVLSCTCAGCEEDILIKERKIKVLPVYVSIKRGD